MIDKKIILIMVVLLSTLLNADKFKLDTTQNGDGVGVDFEYATYLGKKSNILMEVQYSTNRDDRVEDFTLTDREGKKGTKIDESNMALYFGYGDSYNDFNFSVELGYEDFRRDKEQLGYYESKGNHLPYDHFVKLKGNQFNIKGEVYYINPKNKIQMRLKTVLTPQTKLDIEQNTKIFPNNIEGGDLKSSTTLGFSYYLEAEAKWKIFGSYSIGLEGDYGFIPYEYDLKVKKGDSFEKRSQSYDEIRSKYLAKFYMDIGMSESKNGFHTSVGYGQNKIERSGFNTLSQNIIEISIAKWF